MLFTNEERVRMCVLRRRQDQSMRFAHGFLGFRLPCTHAPSFQIQPSEQPVELFMPSPQGLDATTASVISNKTRGSTFMVAGLFVPFQRINRIDLLAEGRGSSPSKGGCYMDGCQICGVTLPTEASLLRASAFAMA